jgi:hypothetical protein
LSSDEDSRPRFAHAALVSLGSRHHVAQRLRAAGPVYYLGGGALVDPDVRDISLGVAVALGIGIIVACGFVYDVMMASPLAVMKSCSPRLLTC